MCFIFSNLWNPMFLQQYGHYKCNISFVMISNIINWTCSSLNFLSFVLSIFFNFFYLQVLFLFFFILFCFFSFYYNLFSFLLFFYIFFDPLPSFPLFFTLIFAWQRFIVPCCWMKHGNILLSLFNHTCCYNL